MIDFAEEEEEQAVGVSIAADETDVEKTQHNRLMSVIDFHFHRPTVIGADRGLEFDVCSGVECKRSRDHGLDSALIDQKGNDNDV